jgi:hypothetical protein
MFVGQLAERAGRLSYGVVLFKDREYQEEKCPWNYSSFVNAVVV